jgi:hypothetical protein
MGLVIDISKRKTCDWDATSDRKVINDKSIGFDKTGFHDVKTVHN